MKGVIFNLLEEVVSEHYGEPFWEGLLDHASAAGAYTSLGSYPDAELENLVLAACGTLGTSRSDVLRWFGRAAMPLLAARYPAFFREHASTRSFILSLNQIIHPEVMKLYPGARCPAFNFSNAPDGALLVGYNSHRQLCMLAHGFVEGAGAHFGEAPDIRHLQCMHGGDPACTLRIAVE